MPLEFLPRFLRRRSLQISESESTVGINGPRGSLRLFTNNHRAPTCSLRVRVVIIIITISFIFAPVSAETDRSGSFSLPERGIAANSAPDLWRLVFPEQHALHLPLGPLPLEHIVDRLVLAPRRELLDRVLSPLRLRPRSPMIATVFP